jgi:Oxidoreductase molybdopterin binding domain
MSIVSRGFRGRRERPGAELPPGQYLVQDFPVLSAGPPPAIDPAGLGAGHHHRTRPPPGLGLGRLPSPAQRAGHRRPPLCHPLVQTRHQRTGGNAGHPARGGGHQRRLCPGVLLWRLQHQPALEDLPDDKAWVAFGYDGAALAPEHGGPARLLVPHLSLWKSAKWVRGIQPLDTDEPGFWERLGDHNSGDPWLQQRFWGD